MRAGRGKEREVFNHRVAQERDLRGGEGGRVKMERAEAKASALFFVGRKLTLFMKIRIID